MNYIIKFFSIIYFTRLFTTSGLIAGEIHDAAVAGDLNKVRELLEADPSLMEAKDKDGLTPLYAAIRGTGPAYFTQVEVANYLLDKGADVKVRSNWGGTPLTSAILSIQAGEYELIQRLLAKGLDVNASHPSHNEIFDHQGCSAFG